MLVILTKEESKPLRLKFSFKNIKFRFFTTLRFVLNDKLNVYFFNIYLLFKAITSSAFAKASPSVIAEE